MKYDYDPTLNAQNKYGEWAPAISEPLWTGFLLRRAQCWTCKDRPTFKSRDEYRGHFALKHILGL